MDAGKPAMLAVGLVVGGGAVLLLRPAPAAVPSHEGALVDGRYLVFHTDYGNWIYERQDGGGFKPVVKELSPLGLKSIWGLQAEFKPMTLATAKGEILYVPYTQYSTETGSFNTTHKFFQMGAEGLVEVPLGVVPKAAPAPR